MKELIYLKIYRQSKYPDLWWGVGLDDQSFFQLMNFCIDEQVFYDTVSIPREERASFSIIGDAKSAAIGQIEAMLQSWEWYPYLRLLPRAKYADHYDFRITREWEEEDLQAAELLRVTRFGPVGPLFLNDPSNVRRGSVESVTEFGPGWLADYGRLDPNRFGLSGRVKGDFQNLRGIMFHEVFWDRPEAVESEFWEFTSNVVMPPCLLDIVAEDMSGGLFYDEPGYRTEQLQYSRAAVSKLPPFDVAFSREVTGDPKKFWTQRRELIVSQEFRRRIMALEQSEEMMALFEPVKLV
jgi:hypothetical protein